MNVRELERRKTEIEAELNPLDELVSRIEKTLVATRDELSELETTNKNFQRRVALGNFDESDRLQRRERITYLEGLEQDMVVQITSLRTMIDSLATARRHIIDDINRAAGKIRESSIRERVQELKGLGLQPRAIISQLAESELRVTKPEAMRHMEWAKVQ